MARWQGQIAKRIMDPTHWGIAKSLVMQAKAEGIDIDDQLAVEKYLQNYKEKMQKVNPSSYQEAPCPCGSGEKYKNCCGKEQNK
jgi:uncharacterized protein YecA (UPF0149 family)